MSLFSSLSREQKESIGLLQIGTFLEYFDLMLYVHMAVLLNELFFPQSDSHTASLLAAFTFSSAFIFRPIGALFFGWMGDHFGRKSTIIWTTIIMSISCFLMANLPTYAQIGISAAWLMTFCRIAQGMSSMGEIVGAQIFIAESIRRPASYPAVALITLASPLGSMCALGVSFLVTSFYLNWRLAFWIGAVIALIGAVARTRLRETPDFLEMKREQLKRNLAAVNHDEEIEEPVSALKKETISWKDRVRFKTLISYFAIACGWPLSFYLGFIYFNQMLKDNFGYSTAKVIQHNFFLSLVFLLPYVFTALLSYRIHPLKILKVRAGFGLLLMAALPFLILNISSPVQLFFVQFLILLFPLDSAPAEAVFIYHLPIAKRCTLASFLFAFSRAMVYVVTSFGLIYLTNYFGIYGLLFITIPVASAYFYGVLYFEGLERKLGMFAPNPYYLSSGGPQTVPTSS